MQHKIINENIFKPRKIIKNAKSPLFAESSNGSGSSNFGKAFSSTTISAIIKIIIIEENIILGTIILLFNSSFTIFGFKLFRLDPGILI